MSNFWWLQPGWTETLCAHCGATIWPEGDPDWGLCWSCWQEQAAAQLRSDDEAGAGIAEGGLSERMQPACGSAEAPAATTASADPDSASASSHPSCIAEGGKTRDE